MVSGANLFAQISEKGTPKSFENSLEGIVPTVYMQDVDLDRYLAEDQEDADDKDIPFRFGAQIDVDFSMTNSGIWSDLPDGGRVWRLSIKSEGAYSLNLLYDNFYMPQGAQFFLYNQDKSSVLGAFTSQNNKEHGKFSTGLTAGDEVTLEYYEPANVFGQGVIEISRVVHAYRDIMNHITHEGFGSSGSCNNNVNCPESEGWENQIRSVAMILTGGGSRVCSGFMVNNVRQDLTPYFMTANHCLGGNDSWIIMFKYQSPSCENIDGPTNFTVQGTDLLASNSSSDFALLLLNESPPEDYEVHYAGWNAVDEASTNSVGIHHPSGDIKKISWDNDPATSSDYDPSPYLPNSHWEVTAWDDGTTEPGSSGSPLFDQNHRVTGQLHGGWASCTSITEDYYGKFSMSWDYGSTPSTRLKDWLDPDNTGTLVLDGWDPTIGEPDFIPPTPIVDLVIDDVTSSEVMISWTAPYDTSYGGVRAYDIRYSTTAITDTNDFYNGTMVDNAPVPADSGETQSFTIGGLEFATTYYIAIRSRDMFDNWSELSNVVMDATYDAPEISVTPASVHVDLNPGGSATENVNVANVSQGNSTLDYMIELANNTFPNTDAVKVRLIQKNETVSTEQAVKGNDIAKKGSSVKGAGGPDMFGYEWIDSDEAGGPEYIWEDISTTGTAVTDWIPTGTFNELDEGVAGPFDLGFNFKFYGIEQTDVYFGTNGFVTFENITMNTYTNDEIPDSDMPNSIIASVWDDMDGGNGGTVYYQQMGNKFVIQYDNWGEYFGSGTFTYQVVLYSSGKIMLYYKSLTGDLNSATVGIENADGSDGLQMVYNSDYLHDELAVKISAEPDWLQLGNMEGRLYNGNSVDVELSFSDDDYPQGDYSMDVIITSNDPDMSEIVVPVTMTLGEGGGATDWSADISVYDAGGMENGLIITFGQAQGATDGLDAGFNEFELPPVPPAGVFDSRFILPNDIPSLTDIRALEGESATWEMTFQPGGTGYPVTLAWDSNDLPDGSWRLQDPFGGVIVDVNMKDQSMVEISNTSVTALNIVYSSQMMIEMSMASGWNLMSIPLEMDDMAVSQNFPEATSPAYAYENGYVTADDFAMGVGYWLKFDAPVSHEMWGLPYYEPVAVADGWNLIAFYQDAVPVTNVTSNPAGIVSSMFFGFDQGYYTADNLEAGKAYWVKTSEAGELSYSGAAPKKGETTLPSLNKEGWKAITIRDADGRTSTLYASDDEPGIFAELPPAPPAGVFDVRFKSGKMAEKLTAGQSISISGATYPVVISADLDVSLFAAGENATLKAGDSYTLTQDVSSVEISTVEIPDEFALEQNYPNPFNPSTKIKFAVPVDSKVTVTLYNMLGQKVKEIVSQNYSVGLHEVELNASELASGMYIYNISAQGVDGNNFVDTKKMMLMK
ncbi:MAG: hypothetical protein SCALA702_24360 [Melioribacteraceae bacterium]|nr:MAG: hypothetical protein SCALA702_24360 [Melioribacteraceae bacterium]